VTTMTTKTTGQRTPGPWKVRYEKSRDRFVLSGTHDNIGDFGCFKGYEVDGVTGEGEDEANAAFIVRACNNHDVLVKALQSLFEHCAMVHKCWGDGDNTKEADAAIKAGEAAIASATKET